MSLKCTQIYLVQAHKKQMNFTLYTFVLWMTKLKDKKLIFTQRHRMLQQENKALTLFLREDTVCGIN